MVAAVAIAVVTAVAAIDHARKVHALQRANVSEWFCAHRGIDCNKRKHDDIEDAWNSREHVYKGLDVAFFVVAVAVIAVRRRQE